MAKSRGRRKKGRQQEGASTAVNWAGGGYSDSKRKRDWRIAGIAAVVVASGAVWWLWSTASGHRDIAALAEAGASVLERVERTPNLGQQHVAPGTPVAYDSDFPTSGDHWPIWAQTGVYDQAQPPPMLVHALEHGNIVIYYDTPGDAAWADMTAWAGLYTGQWDGMVVTPKPGLGDDVVLTAWTRRLRLDAWDPEAAAAFVDAFRGRGPENPVR